MAYFKMCRQYYLYKGNTVYLCTRYFRVHRVGENGNCCFEYFELWTRLSKDELYSRVDLCAHQKWGSKICINHIIIFVTLPVRDQYAW